MREILWGAAREIVAKTMNNNLLGYSRRMNRPGLNRESLAAAIPPERYY